MEFIRVNDHMIKCLISEEDMQENDITLEDFFSRKECAMDFLHEIIKQAELEVDYHPAGPLTSMQIAPIPDNGIAIFLPEDAKMDIKSILQTMKDITNHTISEEVVEKIENATPVEQAQFLATLMENVKSEVSKKKDVLTNAGNTVKDDNSLHSNLERKMFEFESVSEVIRYASVIHDVGKIGCCLYKDEDTCKYYLILDRLESDSKALAEVYLTAYEYGKFISDSELVMEHVKEHCTCIIDEFALQKIQLK